MKPNPELDFNSRFVKEIAILPEKRQDILKELR